MYMYIHVCIIHIYVGMSAYICSPAYSYIEDRITDACVRDTRTHVLRWGVCARMGMGLGTPATALNRALSVGMDRVRFGLQAFSSASAFNANIASWNVLRVTTYTSGFESVGLADCIKLGVYDAWGSTLRTAYPTWGSLSAVCATPAPSTTPSTATPSTATPSTATPRYACPRERVISSPGLAADFDSYLRTRTRLC
jgi:hypothetical protein